MMTNIFNTIIIEPIKLVFDVVFQFELTGNLGVSIVALSLVLNIILLPLYNRAEEIQNEENEVQKKLKPGIDKIKKAFKSDEQYMILQTYYRQNNYKPIYSLRSLLPLLLEIPFFIAAYSYLTNLSDLAGQSFLFIKDLGQPDQLLNGINILPIIMTLVNVVSCVIYTKGQPFKAKIQLYAMALVFLVLLYNTVSGLAFYYLLNNVFSLIKNIINKSKHKTRILSLLLIVFGLALLSLVLLVDFSLLIELIIFALALIILVLSIYTFINKKLPSINLKHSIIESKYSFLLCTIFMCLLTGLLIPTQVISASPEEFVDITTYLNPLNYIFNSFLLSFGVFVLWFNVYYLLMDKKVKNVMSLIMWSICIIGLTNHLFFKNNLGTISNLLAYEETPEILMSSQLINLAVCAVLFIILIILWQKNNKLVKQIVIIACITFITMSSINAVKINNAYKNVVERTYVVSNNNDTNSNEPYFTLSQTNKNVIVLMLDRAISTYFPYIIQEKPILKEQFKGFTYYPNTISFAASTNAGAPPLFGGYEYTPDEMNKRSNDLLIDKNNEALKVLPVLFYSNDFDVTVSDIPYANYEWIPDLSIYNDYPQMKAFLTEYYFGNYDMSSLNRNLFCYSLTKASPNILFGVMYNSGNYMMHKDKHTAQFMRPYNALCNYINITRITKDKGSFLMLQNSAAHEPLELQYPDYTVSHSIDNSGFEGNTHKEDINGNKIELKLDRQIQHYHVNAATLLRVGEWLDYLRDNDVYDNTRIIIAADHSCDLELSMDLMYDDYDLTRYNPLLLVKDFDSKEFVIDDTFMTNADVPYLATKDVIDNPINMFTGVEITKNKKTEFSVVKLPDVFVYKENYQYDIDKWYTVKDNCLDIKNWNQISK